MIPQHYPIEPGTIYGGEYPGDRNPEVARAKIRALLELGVRTLIDLTAQADRMEPYEELLAELELETGTRLRRIAAPIPDMGVPGTRKAMAEIMDAARELIASGPAT